MLVLKETFTSPTERGEPLFPSYAPEQGPVIAPRNHVTLKNVTKGKWKQKEGPKKYGLWRLMPRMGPFCHILAV